MPVITALGLRWQIASDFIPFLAAWGLLSHCVWFLIVGILFLTSRPATCASVNDTNANLYESVVDGTLAMFAATMLVEIVLIVIGLRGTPFQESKRKAMIPALYFRMLMWFLQTVYNAYATWVVEGPRTPACYNFNNRDVNMRAMVYLSWGFIVLNWVRVWAVYTLFPDYQDIQSWRRRARILVFGCIKDRQTKDIQEQLKQQGEKPLKRTTRVFAGLVRELDLAPTDQVVGLILLAALQRRRRGIHISTMLRPDQVPTGATLRELRAARGTSLDLTSQLEGHLERMLTGNATDIGAMLAGVREHHDTLVSALEGEPAAAASLADSGVLNALQTAVAAVEDGSTVSSLQRSGSMPRSASVKQSASALRRSSTLPNDRRGSKVSFGAALQDQDRGQAPGQLQQNGSTTASVTSAVAAASAVASSIAGTGAAAAPSGASGPSAAEDTAEAAQELARLQHAAGAGAAAEGSAAAPPPVGMADPALSPRASAFQAAAAQRTGSGVSGSSGDAVSGTSPRSYSHTAGGSSAAEAIDRLESRLSAALNEVLSETAMNQQPSTAEEVSHEIARSNLSTFLTPSSIAAELRPDLDPVAAAAIYTGAHKHVDPAVLRQARTFAKYATTVYGASFIEWLEKRNKWYTRARLLLRRGYNAYQANELNAEKITTFSDHLNYEAVVQYAGIADNDLLYFSYTNQALGALPYIVVLDHATKSVVVSVRGSVSTADWVTDFLGIPEVLDEWLPDAFKEEHPDLGTCYAHSGILAAAKAVWADLEEHGILQVLLDETDGGKGSKTGQMDAEDKQKQRQQAQQFNKERKSAAGGEGSSHTATMQQDTTHHEENFAGLDADKAAHGVANGLAGLWSKVSGRPSSTSEGHSGSSGGGGGRVSPAGPRDMETGNADAEPAGSAPDSTPSAGNVHGPEEAGHGQKKAKDDNLEGHKRGQYAAAIMKRGIQGQGWKLVVTGHSLGAGVAALLSLKLRHSFPGTQCWAFCPPGGLVSANLSAAMAPFCTSVIVGKDAISRVSMNNLAGMMDEVLIALARCRQPTCKVLLSMARRSWRQQTIDQLLFAPEEVPQEALERLHRYQATRPDLQKILHPMLPPGRAIFMRRMKNKITAKEKRARDKAARKAARRERKAEQIALKKDRKAQARTAKQQGAAAKHERKVEAREARHEGHRGIRASLDKGANFARGRVAALARVGSGAVAPSGLAALGGPEAGLRGADPDTRGAGVADAATSVAAGADAVPGNSQTGGAVASVDRLGGRRGTLAALPEGRVASVAGSQGRSRVSSLDMWLPEAAVAPPPPAASPAGPLPQHEGLRRSRDTGLLPATSADVAAGSVQATPRVSTGGTQLGRVADHQTEPDNGGVAGIEEGQAALRRQLDSQASGLSAADRAASAPTSAGALAAAGSAHAEPAAAANDAGAAQRAASARPPGGRKPPRRKRSRAARQSGEQGVKGPLRAAFSNDLDAAADAAVDELAPVSDESDTGGNMGRGGSIGSADELSSGGSELDEEEAAEEAAEAAEAAADSSPEDDDKVVYERLWDAVWVHPQEVIDEGILISPRMTSDHYTTSLVGSLQAVLTGGRETGTLEQQAGGAEPVQPHAPVDRLRSLALNRSGSAASYSPSRASPSAAGLAKASGGSGGANASDAAGVDIGGGGYTSARSRLSGLTDRLQRHWSAGSGAGRSRHGGVARHAVRDMIPG